ncbi:MAG: hypothetical protein ABEK50_09650, partial [bacterium]
MTTVNIEETTDAWSDLVRSPAEQAYHQLRAFPHHALDSISGDFRLDPSAQVLNLGGGVGILASHLKAALGEEGSVTLADPSIEYLQADLPQSLYYEAALERCQVDCRALPFG